MKPLRAKIAAMGASPALPLGRGPDVMMIAARLPPGAAPSGT